LNCKKIENILKNFENIEIWSFRLLVMSKTIFFCMTIGKCSFLNHPFRLTISYATPKTLGIDRMVLAAGATAVPND
jgi:type III pantothenate kinase